MPYCAILQCKNDSRTKNRLRGGISYYRFPKDCKIKEAWVKATGRLNWFPSKASSICSEHFTESDFLISQKGYHFLKTSSVPTKKILSFIENKHLIDPTPGPSKKQIKLENLGSQPIKKSCIKKDNSNNEQEVTSTYLKNMGSKVIECLVQKIQPTAKSLEVKENKETKATRTNKGDRNQQKVEHMFSQKPDSEMLNEQDCVTLETQVIGKTEGINEDQGSSIYSTPRKQKLECRLRWSEEKIKKQNLKIKQLQSQNRKLRKKITSITELLEALEKKFAIKKEDLDNLKNTNIELVNWNAKTENKCHSTLLILGVYKILCDGTEDEELSDEDVEISLNYC